MELEILLYWRDHWVTVLEDRMTLFLIQDWRKVQKIGGACINGKSCKRAGFLHKTWQSIGLKF